MPAAAADWALTLSDPNSQRSSISTIAQQWAQTDSGAARNFVTTIASGPVRDSAIDGLIAVSAQAGKFDPTLLDAYSSPELAQRGVSRAVVQIGRIDPEEAERLIHTYITDEAVRQQTRDQLERMNAVISSSGIVISSGGVILR